MDTVFLLPLPQDLPLLQRIIPATSEIELYMQQQVWVEMDYRFDIRHVTKGRFLQHSYGMQRKILGESLFICSHMLQSLPPFKSTNFIKCVREL